MTDSMVQTTTRNPNSTGNFIWNYSRGNNKQTQHWRSSSRHQQSIWFDKVCRDGLKHKILQLNLLQPLTRIIADYVFRRTASITIDNFTEPSFELTSGVPQGRCLSPTLFNLYTQDLPDLTANSEHIYADDITQIITKPGSKQFHTRQVTRAIENINKFEHIWKIKINQAIFNLIPIGRCSE